MARADERIPRYYARAFLATVLEMRGEAALSDLEREFEVTVKVTGGEIGTFLASPVFHAEEKFAVVEQFAKENRLSAELTRLIRLLISERQLALLPSIAAEYGDALHEHRNETHARVRSAFPMKPEEQERLSRALGRATGKKVLMNVEIDPGLIGGVVAEVNGTVYDASISGFLARLKEEFAV
jgi:F-type H+-transporting ATPase subunit delta